MAKLTQAGWLIGKFTFAKYKLTNTALEIDSYKSYNTQFYMKNVSVSIIDGTNDTKN
ncbi:hypothetical protein GCM10028807_15070 [Spirosoma daeguense]